MFIVTLEAEGVKSCEQLRVAGLVGMQVDGMDTGLSSTALVTGAADWITHTVVQQPSGTAPVVTMAPG